MTYLGEEFKGSDGMWRRVFRLNKHDQSPIHKHWQHGNYDSQCSSCFLGYAHSTECHADAILNSKPATFQSMLDCSAIVETK